MSKQGGFGVIVKIEVSAALTAIANLEDMDYPEFEKFLVDVTHHSSAGGYSEWIASGNRALNEFTVTLTWDVAEATHAAILTAFDSDTTVNMSIQDPDGVEVITFAAHIRKIGRMSKQKNRFGCTVTIQPTGLPVIT